MLGKLFSKLTGSDDKADGPEHDEAQNRVAFAALLIETARADEVYTDEEKALITGLLKRQYALDDADALALREKGEAAQAEANDMYQFSRVVKNELSAEDKTRLIEGMWEVILSDDARDPYEEMIVRRLCGLIYMPDVEAQEARRRVEARLAAR